ncbi:MAG: response regulator transcription factor [Acidimicrobiia bacterium]
MKVRVLVAEDEPTISLVVCRSLEAAGYQVVAARDGLQALEAGLREKFDLAILDQQMPGLQGIEVLQKWREQERHFPVMFLSAMADEEDVVRGLELGAVDYIRKPFSARELLARVRAHLHREVP